MKNYANFLIQEKLLLENRIQDLKTKWSEKIDPEIIDYFEKNDPTTNKAYFEWLLKTWYNMDEVEKEKLEELKRPVPETFIKFVEQYHKMKPKLTGEDAHIENFRRILQLYRVIERDKDYSTSVIKSKGQVDVLVNNYEWLIFTPYDYEISEEYGHNHVKEPESKNWCTCYDEDYFIEHFGPYGAMTYIINKFDETKDLALEKKKSGEIVVWDYKDEDTLYFDINHQDKFLDYLKRFHEDFIYQYFKEKPLTENDLSTTDLDDLRERWVDNRKDDEYYLLNSLDNNDWSSNFDYSSAEEHILNFFIEEIDDLDEAIDEMSEYIEENIGTEESLEDKTSTELIEMLRNNDMWENFITEWFDKYVQGNASYVEEFIEKYFGKETLLNFLDIDQYLSELSQNFDFDDLKEFVDF